jgi:hypothetical protein
VISGISKEHAAFILREKDESSMFFQNTKNHFEQDYLMSRGRRHKPHVLNLLHTNVFMWPAHIFVMLSG